MKTIPVFFCTALIFCFTLLFCSAHANTEISIIRNGGYPDLIENNLVATSVAISQGADYLELPVNISADDQLIVFKDTTLNRLTDVADLFPIRHREDGNYYVVDFTLGELRQLRLRMVFEEDSNSLSLGISTLTEELTLIRKLNSILGKNTGIVIGLQEPAFYRAEGKDMSTRLRQNLNLLSYGPHDKLFLQCADPDELQKIGKWTQTESSNRFSLIQLIKPKQNAELEQTNELPIQYQHDWLFTNSGLRILASYAAAVAFPADSLKKNRDEAENMFHAIRNYGIKIFIESPEDNKTVYFPGYASTMNPPAEGSIKKDFYFDGIYLDSIQMSLIKEEKPETSQARVQPADAVKTSTLPPFFSNLGLSQPKHTKIGTNSITEKNITSEELE